MTARDDVLVRIAGAHHAAPPPDLPYAAIERAYRTTTVLDEDALVERLVDRLLDYKALVRRCGPDQVAEAVAEALHDRGVGSIAVPTGFDEAWLTATSVEVLSDRDEQPLSVDALDRVDGVVTGCALAVAETGTLVLDGSSGQGRRVLALIPDYHLCVVLPGQVCADVPQMIDRLDLTRPTTMISGPSATSDIELNRVEGVHGPRTLEVVVVVDDSGHR